MLLHSPPGFSLQMLWSHSCHCLTHCKDFHTHVLVFIKTSLPREVFFPGPFIPTWHLSVTTFSNTQSSPGACKSHCGDGQRNKHHLYPPESSHHLPQHPGTPRDLQSPHDCGQRNQTLCQSAPGTAQGSWEMFVTHLDAQMNKRGK